MLLGESVLGLRPVPRAFPWLAGPVGPALHRWHLACEFSQWLEAAAAEAAR
jgi:hypothetical protein